MQQAVIFDMDGVIIDSEPLWQAAEIKVFQTVGLHLTHNQCHETKGLRTDQVIRHWYDRHPWEHKSLAQVEQELFAEMQFLIKTQGQPMPGLYELLHRLAGLPYQLAIASSSPMVLINAVVDKFALGDYFGSSLYSGYDVPRGKPDPAVYLAAANGLGVEPGHCLAIEDSGAGVQAAKAAGMRVIAVPEAKEYNDRKFAIADIKVPSLIQIQAEMIIR
jgi:mannitol-1-/sugar-/sorbitol-6-/2-deoxyglucose-6-phosphatase